MSSKILIVFFLFHIKSFTFLAAYRYVASDLATDVVVNVGDVKFYLHKVN